MLVSLLMTGILSLGTLVIESSRYQAAKTYMDDAGASIGTSFLANYDKALYERFGILSMNVFGSSKGEENAFFLMNGLSEEEYSENNISSPAVLTDDSHFVLYYSLAEPIHLRRQMLVRAKYNTVPQDYYLNYYNMDYIISDYRSKCDLVESKLNSVTNAGSGGDVPQQVLSALDGMRGVFADAKKYNDSYDALIIEDMHKELPSKVSTATYQMWDERIEAARNDATTILGSEGEALRPDEKPYVEDSVSIDTEFIKNADGYFASSDAIYNNAYAAIEECRSLIHSLNGVLSTVSNSRDDMEETLLLNSYITRYFPNKNCGIEGASLAAEQSGGAEGCNFSQACAEYIFTASRDEKENQASAYDYIMASRLVYNLYSVFSQLNDPNTFNPGSAYSVAAYIAWAYYETYADTRLLFDYGAVVAADKREMIFPVTDAQQVISTTASGDFVQTVSRFYTENGENGIYRVEGYDEFAYDYKSALAFALWFVGNSDKVARTADLIELEINQKRVSVGLDPDAKLFHYFTYIGVDLKGHFNPILPVISPTKEGGLRAVKLESTKYIGY